ncbi:hypothetical protein [Achromobacter insolitus]|uniref:hypothetical protein n=1 Tax=Achromobacter insolitus TaxID=217204 RepID=UPI003672B7AE
MMMFVDLHIPTDRHSATSGDTQVALKSPRSGRPTKIDQLRALILAGGHLRDPAKGITLANLRTQRELAAMVGLRSHRNVSRVIRREFPEIAAVMDERQPNPGQESPKKGRFLWYVANGRHLRDPEGEATAGNIKSQQEIAEDLGMTQPTISVYMREYFPGIASVMTKRSGRYRGK